MSKPKFFTSFAVIGILALSACSHSWKTDYGDIVDPELSKNWNIAAVDVQVPDSLTVSEANRYAPSADIVWREDSLAGETDREKIAAIRRQQVDAIITKAVWRGTKASFGKYGSALHGKQPVILLITMQQFHALSQKARLKLNRSGVHNITFTAQFIDQRTGAELTTAERIDADLFAYVGDQAHNAVAQGQTQKVRISNHVADVIAGWLGHGRDVRSSFARRGR